MSGKYSCSVLRDYGVAVPTDSHHLFSIFVLLAVDGPWHEAGGGAMLTTIDNTCSNQISSILFFLNSAFYFRFISQSEEPGLSGDRIWFGEN